MMETFERVKTQLAESMKESSRLFDSFPWENKEAYAWWLSQTYYYVCHSTRLLAASAARFSREENRFHLRFAQHMREEKSHEFLALSDLKELGYAVDPLPELALTAALYQSQYFRINYQSPFSLLGYILFLEALAVTKGKEVYQRVSQAHGEKACRFWKVHAEEDPDHLDEAFRQIENAPLPVVDDIFSNLDYTASIYHRMILEIRSLLRSENKAHIQHMGLGYSMSKAVGDENPMISGGGLSLPQRNSR